MVPSARAYHFQQQQAKDLRFATEPNRYTPKSNSLMEPVNPWSQDRLFNAGQQNYQLANKGFQAPKPFTQTQKEFDMNKKFQLPLGSNIPNTRENHEILQNMMNMDTPGYSQLQPRATITPNRNTLYKNLLSQHQTSYEDFFNTTQQDPLYQMLEQRDDRHAYSEYEPPKSALLLPAALSHTEKTSAAKPETSSLKRGKLWSALWFWWCKHSPLP